MSATALEQLETTESGSVRKKDALRWLNNLETAVPEDAHEELIGAVTPKPYRHEGSAFPTPISQVRVTGAPEFVEAVARLFTWFTAWESSATRLAVNVKEVEDRETGERTGNYALYLSAAERGREGKLCELLMGGNRANDQRLLAAVEGEA